jgi:glycosyltransferase (activator-dependent family)
MRILFAANPEKAHLLAMAPLGWALRTAGHEVRFAVQPKFADAVTQAGLTAVPVGRDGDLWDLMPRDPRNPDWSWNPEFGLFTPYDVVDHPERATWQHLLDGYTEVQHTWHKPGCFPMITGLVEFARHWRPDLIIWEPLAFAGPIAATACGAAHGRLLWGVDVFGVARRHFRRLSEQQPAGDRPDPLGNWLAGYARRYGGEFTEAMVTGQFTIDQLPASLRYDAGLSCLPMRYTPYGGPAVVPKWLWEPPRRPRVALTMGLSLTDHQAGYQLSVQEVLDALADLKIEVIATLPGGEQARLDRKPDNARLIPYVPLQALVPSCAVVIHHGGFGTVLTTAQHPVPQLAVPWDFDAPALARRIAAQGAALSIRADEATGPAIRASVQRLLDEPGFRARAELLRDEIWEMASPNQLVPQLEEHTIEHRTN